MDKRMAWVLLLNNNAQKENKEEASFIDYEICSEVKITGLMDYGNGSLRCSLLSDQDSEGLYSYTLRVKYYPENYTFNENTFTKKGYYFQGGIVGELIAIFSVYFQNRFFLKSHTLGSQIKSENLPTRTLDSPNYIRPNKKSHYEMFNNIDRNWADDKLRIFLDKIMKLDQKYHQNLILSFNWYLEAVKNIGVDHELFYIKIVSCIEAIDEDIQFDEDALSKKINEFMFNTELSKANEQEIKNWLKNRKIQKKFTAFIQKYSKEFFNEEKREPMSVFIKSKDVEHYSKSIYNARSEYLHNGRPMYISFDPSKDECREWDLDITLGMMADRRSIKEKEKLPRVRFSERIVNFCIKRFIDEKSSQ